MDISVFRSLRTRLIAFLIATILVTAGPVIYYIYNVSQRNMEEKSSSFITSSMNRVSEQFNDLFDGLYKYMLVLTTNRDLWAFLRDDQPLNYRSATDLGWIRNQISTYRILNTNIYSIFILDFHQQYVISSIEGPVSANENSRVSEYISFMFDPGNNVWERRLIIVKDNGSYYKQFTGVLGRPDTYSIIVPIHEAVLGAPLGVMAINLADTAVLDLIRDTHFTEGSSIYLVNGQGTILAANREHSFGDAIPREFAAVHDRSSNRVNYNSRDFLVTKTNTLYNDWSFVSVVPYNELIAPDQKAIKLVLFYIIVALVVISAILLVLIERFFYKPIYRLLREIRQWNNREPGMPQAVSPFQLRMDEIGFLFRNLNAILRDREQLVKDVYLQQLIIQDTKIRLLYSQINPHFLYNTLDNIRWLAMGLTGGDNRVSQTIQSLSGILKHNAQIEKQMLTIGEELHFTNMYLDIQKVRHGDKVAVEWYVAEALKSIEIMRFLLQPLLENAITHGIERSEYNGRILVTIRRTEDRLLIVVEDNGVGMDEQRLHSVRQMMEGSAQTDNKGIGLRNIMDRIRWYYGAGANITIESVRHEGTSVTVTLPMQGGDSHV